MEALWRAGLRVTQFLSSGLRGDSRPHAQFPFLQSKEGSVCRARSLGHKNRIFERLDFPFLTVDLLRKRHFNKIFFFSSVFQKTTFNGGSKVVERTSQPYAFSSPDRRRWGRPSPLTALSAGTWFLSRPQLLDSLHGPPPSPTSTPSLQLLGS